MAGLEFVLKELNPKYDMNKAEMSFRPLCSHDQEPLGKAVLEMTKTTGCRLYYMVKPFARGGLIGAGIGSAVSLIAGEDVSQGAATGALIGLTAEIVQMYPRLMYTGVRIYAREIKQLFRHQ